MFILSLLYFIVGEEKSFVYVTFYRATSSLPGMIQGKVSRSIGESFLRAVLNSALRQRSARGALIDAVLAFHPELTSCDGLRVDVS